MIIGAIITSVTAFLFGIVLMMVGLSFIKGKNIELLAGYSDLSDVEKMSDKPGKMAKLTGKELIIISGLTLAYSGASFVFGAVYEIKVAFIIVTIVFIAAVVAITLTGVAVHFKNQ